MSSEHGGHQQQRLHRKNSRIRKAPRDFSGPDNLFRPGRGQVEPGKLETVWAYFCDVISRAANQIQEPGTRDLERVYIEVLYPEKIQLSG